MKKLDKKEIDFIINLLKTTGLEHEIEGTVEITFTGVPSDKIQGETWMMKGSYAQGTDKLIATVIDFDLSSSKIEIPDEFLNSYEI